MADGWAAGVLAAGMVLLAGRGPWERRRRLEHHAGVAARRLQKGAQADLVRLTARTQTSPEPIQPTGEVLLPDSAGSIFGPDLIGDFYRVVIAELKIWADEAGEELERLHGRKLQARRAALRELRAEIRALCVEIEEREAFWQEALALTEPEGREGGADRA
jgi:hypothetical protein